MSSCIQPVHEQEVAWKCPPPGRILFGGHDYIVVRSSGRLESVAVANLGAILPKPAVVAAVNLHQHSLSGGIRCHADTRCC